MAATGRRGHRGAYLRRVGAFIVAADGLVQARFAQPLVQHVCCGCEGIICDEQYQASMASPIETEAGLLRLLCGGNDYHSRM